MNTRLRASVLFYVAALYDGVLGLAFLLAPGRVFAHFGILPPNHVGYVHFPAALLLVFTVMLLAIARNPHENRGLIPYCILLKVAYCGVVFGHWFTAGIPAMWKPFAIADVLFAALFVWAYRALRRRSAGASSWRPM